MLVCYVAMAHFAWAEGNGERICTCWKFLLVHFHEGRRTKCAWEALRLQFQLRELSASVASQLKWGTFINYKGGPGCNIPCYLHNKHINRTIKDIVKNMGGSQTEQVVRRAGQSVTLYHNIISNFGKWTPFRSTLHTNSSEREDVRKVTVALAEYNVFTVILGRAHTHFPGMLSTPLPSLENDRIICWIHQKHNHQLSCHVTEDRNDSENCRSEDEL